MTQVDIGLAAPRLLLQVRIGLHLVVAQGEEERRVRPELAPAQQVPAVRRCRRQPLPLAHPLRLPLVRGRNHSLRPCLQLQRRTPRGKLLLRRLQLRPMLVGVAADSPVALCCLPPSKLAACQLQVLLRRLSLLLRRGRLLASRALRLPL